MVPNTTQKNQKENKAFAMLQRNVNEIQNTRIVKGMGVDLDAIKKQSRLTIKNGKNRKRNIKQD